jgi:hypothetical protein
LKVNRHCVSGRFLSNHVGPDPVAYARARSWGWDGYFT